MGIVGPTPTDCLMASGSSAYSRGRGWSALINPPALSSPFSQETQELQKQQRWYQENQVTLTARDEDLYLSYCSQAMFRIRILEQRLSR